MKYPPTIQVRERMKIVFCGTPEFAVPTLKHLLTQPEFEVAGVITQPDRPSGRGKKVTPSPVKEAALEAGVPIHQPEKIRAPEAQRISRAHRAGLHRNHRLRSNHSRAPDRDSAARLDQPSRLPCCRSIAARRQSTGPSSMAKQKPASPPCASTPGMDTGEMLLQHEILIGPNETAPELATRMSEAGAPLTVETLRGIDAGTLKPRAQNSADASYAPMMKKEDGRIDWSRTATETYNRMRGFTPWPGAYTVLRGKTCQLVGKPVSKEVRGGTNTLPGTIRVQQDGLHVSCGGATELLISSVKMEGSRAMDAMEYARGARLTEGERFGNA